VQDFTPAKPATKLPVATPGSLTKQEQEDLKAKVQEANQGKTVEVDATGKATVTDPNTGVSHDIPATDLTVQDFTPAKPATKLPVATPGSLTKQE
ncbi:hypothetical protein I5842_10510, partial [Streptococcus pneumoniae]|nr:hypothetical protein [Streptococcus pneumoniae]